MKDLHRAARTGDLDQIKSILNEGADINMQNIFGHTPLHGAAFNGKIDAVKMLIVSGADPTIKNCQKMTAYDVARVLNIEDVVEFLEPFQRPEFEILRMG